MTQQAIFTFKYIRNKSHSIMPSTGGCACMTDVQGRLISDLAAAWREIGKQTRAYGLHAQIG